jgi:predicted transcriptional regulator
MRTLDFLIEKNVDRVIDILSPLLKIDRSILVDKFLKYDFSGTEYFDKVFKEIKGMSIKDIKEINWYCLCDAYDLMGEKYPA